MSTPASGIGIIIPCHNHADWVGSAISSVVNQDLPPDEIVVVDNGSQDSSISEIMRTLDSNCISEQKDGYILSVGRNYQNPNIKMTVFYFGNGLGPSKARNIGIQHLLANNSIKIIGFLDSDDEYLPGKISKSARLILEDEIGLVYSDYDLLDIHTGVAVREYKEPYSLDRLQYECIVNNDSLMDREVFELVGLYDEGMRVAEDYDLWHRISKRFIMAHIPESLVLIRSGNYNSTNTVPKEVWHENWAKIRERYSK